MDSFYEYTHQKLIYFGIIKIDIFTAYYQFIFCNRPKAESEENGDEIECQDEVVSLMQDRNQENKLSNETGLYIIYIVFPL